MFLTCLRKELLQHILTLRYALVLCVFVALAMASVAVRTGMYKRLARDQADVVPGRVAWAQDVAQLGKEVGDPSFYAFETAEMGWTVDKPPTPMMIFAGGLENEMTRPITLPGNGGEIYGQPGQVDPRQFWRPLRHYAFRAGLMIDMVHIVAFVCSLLALLLVFDSVSGERERGTLKVLLAGPVPRDTLILSRFAAGLLVLLVPLLLCWLMATVYVTSVGHVALDRSQLARVALMAGYSVAYVSLFFALGIAASCLLKDSPSVLGACFTSWVAAVFLVPGLVPVAVKHLAPVPPSALVLREKASVHADIMAGPAMQWFAEMADSGTYGPESRHAWPALMDRVKEEEARRYADIDRQYTERVRNKLRLSLVLSRVSPTTSYVCASDDLAGTGPSDYLGYLEYLDAYLREFLTAKQTQVHTAWESGGVRPFRADLWPRFIPGTRSARDSFNGAWPDLVLLCGTAVVLFMTAFVAFLRYDPC